MDNPERVYKAVSGSGQSQGGTYVTEEDRHIHAFLIEEYKYANEFALHIQKDRTVTFNLYIILLGALSYAAFQLYTVWNSLPKSNAAINLFIIGLLSFYFIVNICFYARFVTLEASYRECLLHMSKTREYYKNHKNMPKEAKNLIYEGKEPLFLSPTKKMIPRNYIPCGVYTGFEVISLLILGYFVQFFWPTSTWLIFSVLWVPWFFWLLALIVIIAQIRYYRWFLRKVDPLPPTSPSSQQPSSLAGAKRVSHR